MKPILISLALLLGSIGTTTAQDFFLPVSSTSKSAKMAYYKAADLASNVHAKQAMAQIDSALKQDPTFFMAYVLGASYTSGAKKAALITKALALDTVNLTKAEKILRQQLVNWQTDPKAKAGETMSELVAAYPKNPQAYEWASLHAAFTDKDSVAALAYSQKLAKMSPKFAPNYNTMGYLYMKINRMDKAKTAFERYMALSLAEPNAYDSMGEFYATTKDYAKSAEYYDKAAALGLTEAKERADKARELMNPK